MIGSTYIKGDRADKLINIEMLDIMKEGAVIGLEDKFKEAKKVFGQ
ncbi:MAG: hypothetical protein KY055_01795 [Candidatus Nealsonbacteria bacterium]|nr:hypothetical protein [Candidatus Nealsonbacteria bacterium]